MAVIRHATNHFVCHRFKTIVVWFATVYRDSLQLCLNTIRLFAIWNKNKSIRAWERRWVHVNETVLPPHHHHRKKKETRHECKNRSPPSVYLVTQKSLQLLAAVYRLIVPLDLCVCVCVDPFPPFRIRPSITRLAQSPATRAHTGREPSSCYARVRVRDWLALSPPSQVKWFCV
jgi:hypothetical protein